MTFNKINTYKPRIKVLNKEQMWSIHAAALEILATTGFEIKHRGAQKMLLDAGCSISHRGRIRMPAYLAEDALNTAPKRIQPSKSTLASNKAPPVATLSPRGVAQRRPSAETSQISVRCKSPRSVTPKASSLAPASSSCPRRVTCECR